MRYCGNCGVVLYPASLTAGHCLSCGAPIVGEGEELSASQAQWLTERVPDTVESDYRTTQVAPVVLPDAPQLSANQSLPVARGNASARRRLAFAGLGMAFLLIVALVVFLVASGSGDLHGSGVAGATVPNQGSTALHHTPLPGHTPVSGGTPLATQTTAPGTTPTPATTASLTPTPSTTATNTTPTPLPNATTTPAPAPTSTAPPAPPPSMTIAPASFSSLLCLNATATFTLTNNGGSTLHWTATASNSGYVIAPTQDALASGQQEQITVRNIGGSGTVTITDPNATNSPQQVSISCTL